MVAVPSGSLIFSDTNKVDISEKEKSYKFEGKPNHKYRIAVQARTCAGLGIMSWSNKHCITDSKGDLVHRKNGRGVSLSLIFLSRRSPIEV